MSSNLEEMRSKTEVRTEKSRNASLLLFAMKMNGFSCSEGSNSMRNSSQNEEKRGSEICWYFSSISDRFLDNVGGTLGACWRPRGIRNRLKMGHKFRGAFWNVSDGIWKAFGAPWDAPGGRGQMCAIPRGGGPFSYHI